MASHTVPNGKTAVHFTIPAGVDATIVVTDCRIAPAELAAIHLESAPTLQAAVDAELKKRPDARVIVIPDALLTLPIVRGE